MEVSPTAAPVSSSWSLVGIVASPFRLFRDVAAAAAAVFTQPPPPPEPGRYDGFFVGVTPTPDLEQGDEEEEKKVAHEHLITDFGTEADLMGHLHEGGCGIGGKVSTKNVWLDEETAVTVSKIFLLDINRCKNDQQKLFINGERVVWPHNNYDTDLMHAEVVGRLSDLVQDPQTLLNITDAASQNTSIDLRARVEDSFFKKYDVDLGFSPKFEARYFTVSTWIDIGDLGSRVICQIEGDIHSLEKPANSMEELAVVRELAQPVHYVVQGEYDLSGRTIKYRENIEIHQEGLYEFL